MVATLAQHKKTNLLFSSSQHYLLLPAKGCSSANKDPTTQKFLRPSAKNSFGTGKKARKKKDLTKAEKEEKICNYTICHKYFNIDTQVVSYDVKIEIAENVTYRRTFTRQEIYSVSTNVFNSGISIHDRSMFSYVFFSKADDIPMEYQHSYMGFCVKSGQYLFKANSIIDLPSKYVGPFDLGQKGTFEGWKSVVEQHVMQTLNLQFMLIMGLCSVTVGFLQKIFDGSMLVHIYSDSSKGKTTGSALAISTAGNPSLGSKKRSLQIDWGDTFNYRIASLANNYGIPIVIDEASKINTKDISSFIYACCNGSSKGRLSSDGRQKDVYHWCTCCISNGEQSLLPLCNNNQGIRARLLEFSFDSITESAEQAESIKEGIEQNYGFANMVLARYMINHPKKVYQIYETWRKKFRDEISLQSPLIARLSKRLAMIMSTATVASDALQLKFDINGLLQLLLHAAEVQEEDAPINIGERLVDYLTEDYLIHSDRYTSRNSADDDVSFPKNCYAVFNNVSKRKGALSNVDYEVCYFKSQFEKLLQMGGFNNKKLCLQELAKRGYLCHEADRYTTKRKVFGQTIPVYVVRFPKDILSMSNFKIV